MSNSIHDFNEENLLYFPFVTLMRAINIILVAIRLSKDFILSNSVMTLFCVLARSILVFGSIIWDPSTANGFFQHEKVQRTTLILAS